MSTTLTLPLTWYPATKSQKYLPTIRYCESCNLLRPLQRFFNTVAIQQLLTQREYQHKHLSPFERNNGHLRYTANSVKAVRAVTNSTWCTLLNINKVVFRKKQRLVQTHIRFWSDMSKPPWQQNDEHHQPDKQAKARTRRPVLAFAG